MGAYMWAYLAVLLSAQSLTEAAQCGAIADCDDTNGECVDGICFCGALFMGPDCKTPCGTCTGDQVCDAAATCAACDPVCDGTGGSCATVDDTPTCKCNAGWSGPACAIAVTTCGTGKCATTEGDCVDNVCYCKALSYGPHCADTCGVCSTSGQVCTGASACAACNPACYSEGGSCAAVGTTPTCKCNADFSGNDCRTIACSTATAPCQNGGTCDTGVCTCPATYTGLVCELAATACGTGGKCATANGDCVGDVCYCNALSYGPHCADTCAACTTSGQVCTGANACAACNPGCDVNKETCATVDTTATCRCIDGLSGTNCEIITCDGNVPCMNGGTCASNICTCDKDHAGFICEKECAPACTVDTEKCVESSGNPVCKAKCGAGTECQNGGTCTVDDLCNCATGWEGDLCEKAEPVCDPLCTAAQKCVEEDGSNVCKATCANNDACKNNGTCANELCTCAEGWTGDLCTESGASSVVPSVLSMALFMLVIRL